MRDADQVRCKHAVNAESRRNALHVLRLVLVLLLLVTLARGAVCAVLVELFTDVGVPSKGISDNGTNCSSQLTQELLRRLGCSPVVATPGHPQATGFSTPKGTFLCGTASFDVFCVEICARVGSLS